MYCGADRFAESLESILGDVATGIDGNMLGAAEKAGKAARKAWSRNARAAFPGGTGKYAKSIRSTAKKKGLQSLSETGSTMPGLPHLLEKGHATTGGGRVAGREHIAPAADEAFAVFEEAVSDGVDRAL